MMQDENILIRALEPEDLSTSTSGKTIWTFGMSVTP